jgi:hypothetical protein
MGTEMDCCILGVPLTMFMHDAHWVIEMNIV